MSDRSGSARTPLRLARAPLRFERRPLPLARMPRRSGQGPRRPRTGRHRHAGDGFVDDQRGSAVVEFSWLALLLLVPLLYVLLAVFDVQRASYGATAATRAAGRAFIIVPSGLTEDDARARAFEAARVAMADQGVKLTPGQLSISCDPACLQPGSTVTVELTAEVALPLIPDALGGERPAVHLSAVHVEAYGNYREAKGNG